jgi:hypothetical protein
VPLRRHDPLLSQSERADVHARGRLRHLAVRHHAQHGGVFGGVTSLEIHRPRDLLPAQRAVARGLVAGRRGADGALFGALGPSCSVTAGLALMIAPER